MLQEETTVQRVQPTSTRESRALERNFSHLCSWSTELLCDCTDAASCFSLFWMGVSIVVILCSSHHCVWSTCLHVRVKITSLYQFSSVHSLSRVWLFATPWTAACQASLSITNSWSLLKLMSIESVMPSNHLILCWLLLFPSIFPSTRVFSIEPALGIRWLNYWSFSFSISSSREF